ncbi:gamma-glutamyl-gamma-aminobutyrate hydrolase family protein [Massilia horti]|uniref:Gamma-glutamyl-gamma-aminobutyrate hydrolase n=1 Tax=Massilia horti TaxID=2562153 RepID=A0A4Y9T2N5_9BURK|nr:type 1 glutamine amidotransferase [Massilia horti]TFW34063.1 gamma-glutamyl-gamma-aminobutyrate hydrolase [Massilia horti]
MADDNDKPRPPEQDSPAEPARVPDRRAAAGPSSYQRHGDTPFALARRVLSSRWRTFRDRFSRDFMRRTLRIGVSARIYHPEPGASGLLSKNLQYLEESIAQWVMSRDVLVMMVPTVNTNGLLHPSNITLRHYARQLDGLVLQGGADVAPQTYHETPARPEWVGDRARDIYELELLHEFIEAGKPVLGICRGCQLINVAFGGSLFQDVATDLPNSLEHVHSDYDAHRHAIVFPPGSSLGQMFPDQQRPTVNSIHHQAVNRLGRDLRVEAISDPDGVIEAIRYDRADFVMGLQWHPEFHRAGGVDLLDCTPVLDEFLRAARETRF